VMFIDSWDLGTQDVLVIFSFRFREDGKANGLAVMVRMLETAVSRLPLLVTNIMNKASFINVGGPTRSLERSRHA